MTDPEVLCDAETALDLDGHGFALYRVGDEGQLRDGDGRVVLSAPWQYVPAWIRCEFSMAEAKARADVGPVHDEDPPRTGRA